MSVLKGIVLPEDFAHIPRADRAANGRLYVAMQHAACIPFRARVDGQHTPFKSSKLRWHAALSPSSQSNQRYLAPYNERDELGHDLKLELPLGTAELAVWDVAVHRLVGPDPQRLASLRLIRLLTLQYSSSC